MRTWKMAKYNKWHTDETLTWFAIHRDDGVYLLYVDSIFELDLHRGYLIAESPTLKGAKFAAEMLGTPAEEWDRRKPA